MSANLHNKFKKILEDTRVLLSELKEAEQDIKEAHYKAAEAMLNKIIALDAQEIKELNDILKNLSYDDEKLLALLHSFIQECQQIIQKAQELLQSLAGSLDEEHKASILNLLESLEGLAQKQQKAEEAFLH